MCSAILHSKIFEVSLQLGVLPDDWKAVKSGSRFTCHAVNMHSAETRHISLEQNYSYKYHAQNSSAYFRYKLCRAARTSMASAKERFLREGTHSSRIMTLTRLFMSEIRQHPSLPFREFS